MLVESDLLMCLGAQPGQASFHIPEPREDRERERFLGPSQDHIGQKFCKVEPENPDIRHSGLMKWLTG